MINLYYKKESTNWNEALPLGNGNLGAMVYGRVRDEIIQLNEITLWSGHKQDADNEECAKQLPLIRERLFAKDYNGANELAEKYMICKGRGSGEGGTLPDKDYDLPYGYYQTAGELHLDFDIGDITKYSRTLNLESGVMNIDLGIQQRTHFCSFANNVTVSKLVGDICLAATFTRENVTVSYTKDTITASEVMDKGKGITYCTMIKFLSDTGRIYKRGDSIVVDSSDELYIYITTYTTTFSTKSPKIRCTETINKAIKKGFTALLYENIDYITERMSKTSISLPGNKYTKVSIIDRIKKMQKGDLDNALVSLLFQYGRYLLLCSSNDSLPANLQGLWSNEMQTPWNGDYHININLQMNYWHCDTANLSPCYDPYFKFLKFIAENGKKTAKVQYDCRGWVAHTIANPWGFTSPGEHACWGSFICGGAWCCLHIFEHYQFTKDKDFLAEFYPIIKGSAEFFEDFLVRDPNTGYMVTAPSNSPEIAYHIPGTDDTTSICASPTIDNSILYQLFTDVKNISEILDIDKEFADKIIKLRDELPPIKTGKYDRIMEWQEDYEETDPGHRHMSPLIGLFPINLITKSKTPKLFDGCKAFMKRRLENGGAPTGWSKAWCTNLYARLFDGDEALVMINELLSKSTQNNLLNTHPPFQIDGNFGVSSAICEMLLQSHEGFINILPALPKKWHTGSYSGLVARGGYEVSAIWDNCLVTSCTILPKFDGEIKVFVNKKMHTISATKDELVIVI
ncbi:MAG: glycoside hydrolase family 95 protein [Clostridia bacterium]